MYRRCTALALAALLTAGCSTGSTEADAEPQSPEPSEAAPEASAAAEESDAESGKHPLHGTWIGPVTDDGRESVIVIQVSGFTAFQQDGIQCSGNTAGEGDGTWTITLTECDVPIPPATVTPSDDGTTLTWEGDGTTEEYRLKDE